MTISGKGLDIIKRFEKFESKPYVCPAGKNTIGYGTTLYSTVKKLATINPADPAISDAIKMWNKSGGKVLNGLVTRRAMEAELYFS